MCFQAICSVGGGGVVTVGVVLISCGDESRKRMLTGVIHEFAKSFETRLGEGWTQGKLERAATWKNLTYHRR